MTAISVIIPTWCEAASIGATVTGARELGDEVIVVDADSPDGTARIAAAHGARVVSSAKGRGVQLRAGAAQARGELLLFLHADAELGPGARDVLRAVLRDPEVLGGNFRLVFEGESVFARAITLGNDLRCRLFRIYYGDSAPFVRRSVYEELGGFQPFPIFEDYEFARRLERHARGRTRYVRDVEVRVSARRFERAPLRTLAVWGALQALYSFANVHPSRLVSLYADVRRVTARRAPELREAERARP